MGNFITLFVIIILVRLCIKLYRECDQLKSGTNEGLMRAKEELRRAQEDLEKAKRDAAKILRDAKKDYESQRSLAISRLKEEIGKTWFQSECSEIKRLKGEINAERERLGKLENIANKSIPSKNTCSQYEVESRNSNSTPHTTNISCSTTGTNTRNSRTSKTEIWMQSRTKAKRRNMTQTGSRGRSGKTCQTKTKASVC